VAHQGYPYHRRRLLHYRDHGSAMHRVALVRRGRLAFAGNSSTVRQRENAS
jgi:hypothetical protein